MQNKTKSTLIKDALVLFAITLVAAISLGFVYEVTKGPIANAEAEAKAKAYVAVFPEASMVDDKNEEVIGYVEASDALLEANGFSQSTINEVCVAKDDSGNPIGYAMTITSHSGYSGDITFTMGVKPDGTLTSVEIIVINETVGLGMAAAEEEFKGQYSDKLVETFDLIKAGESKVSDNQINAISGATITSNAVTDTVNAGLFFVNELLEKGVGGVTNE